MKAVIALVPTLAPHDGPDPHLHRGPWDQRLPGSGPDGVARPLGRNTSGSGPESGSAVRSRAACAQRALSLEGNASVARWEAFLADAETTTFVRQRVLATPGCCFLASHDLDDLVGDVLVVLVHLRGRFDASRASPKTFAARVIRREILHWLRYRRQHCRDHRRTVALESPTDASETAMTVAADVPDHDRWMAWAEIAARHAAVRAVVESLDPDLQAFAEQLLAGEAPRVAGRCLGWSWRRTEVARAQLKAFLRTARVVDDQP